MTFLKTEPYATENIDKYAVPDYTPTNPVADDPLSINPLENIDVDRLHLETEFDEWDFDKKQKRKNKKNQKNQKNPVKEEKVEDEETKFYLNSGYSDGVFQQNLYAVMDVLR